MRWTGVAAGAAIALAVPLQAAADCGPSCAGQLCVADTGAPWAVARVSPDGIVESIRGPLAAQIAVGDTFALPYTCGACTQLLATLEQPDWSDQVLVRAVFPIDDQGRARCDDEPVDAAALEQAVEAADCGAEAERLDFDSGAICDDTVEGCSAAGAGWSWLGLLALPAAMLRRRQPS